MDIVAKLQCPKCRSRLDLYETPSGGRILSVAFLSAEVEDHPIALERFHPPDSGVDVMCPACGAKFDPTEPYRIIPPLKR